MLILQVTKLVAFSACSFSQLDGSISVKPSNVSGVRCLETGITEVRLNVDAEAMEKDKMKTFVEEVRNTGLMLREPREYYPNNPFYGNEATNKGARIKPWEIVDE